MTGSHEVRGSIPLGSTIIFNKLGAAHWLPLHRLSHYRVTTIQSYRFLIPHLNLCEAAVRVKQFLFPCSAILRHTAPVQRVLCQPSVRALIWATLLRARRIVGFG